MRDEEGGMGVRWKLAVAVSDYSHVCDMFGSWCGRTWDV